jgi:hypothetical protein
MWLVLCVMVLGAMAPTVSRAVAWGNDVRGMEVCTAQGSGYLVVGVEHRDSAPQPSLDHCPFCLQPTDKGAAPPPESAFLFPALGRHIEGPTKQAVFASMDIAHFPPARGPPAIL